MSSAEPGYLAGLNDAQREAVLHEEGPLLILAGAGSGKTRVITSKIAHLLEARGCPAEAILAVAFTNKAAEEMRERVRRYSPAGAGVMIKTFHAFGAWLLRRYGQAAGLSRDFTIYDDEDSLALLRAAVEGRVEKERLRDLSARIARAKDRCLAPEDELAGLSLGELAAEVDFREVYRLYQERLRAAGCLDFGDLLLESVRLLSGQPEVRAQLQSRFRAVLVDEYQDSNHAQFRLLELLYDKANYLCAVGDEDQSIYSFRGAELDNILGFAGHFPGTRVIRLEQNYRSAANILEVATRVVEHNRRRLGKTLWTRQPAGAPVELAVLEDQEAEARFCAGELRRREAGGQRHPVPHELPVAGLRDPVHQPAHPFSGGRHGALLRARGSQGRPGLSGAGGQPARRDRLPPGGQPPAARGRGARRGGGAGPARAHRRRPASGRRPGLRFAQRRQRPGRLPESGRDRAGGDWSATRPPAWTRLCWACSRTRGCWSITGSATSARTPTGSATSRSW